MNHELDAKNEQKEQSDLKDRLPVGLSKTHDKAEREDGHIDFEGLINTRDLGYLFARDGKRIVSRKLLRSGALEKATPFDLQRLNDDYELKTVIDLRTDEEQEKGPDPKTDMPGVAFVDAPILGFSTTGITRENGLAGIAKSITKLKKDPKQVMKDLYPTMLLDEQGVEGYTRFFKTIAHATRGSVLWHCSAGKDRAGLATVLLLTVLEVPHEAIVFDYLATNRYLAGRADDLKKLFPAQFSSQKLVEGLKTLNSADEDFLHAGIKAVDEAYGSLNGYLKEALKVDDAMREELKNKYLQP